MSDGSTVFGFNTTDADYPGVGDSLGFSEDPGAHKLGVKWQAPGGVAWFGYMTEGVTMASDHKSVTFDGDLPTTPDHPEHVKGSVDCAA